MNTLTNFLPQVKDLNNPRWNLNSRKDLQKSIKDTIVKYEEIIFIVDTPISIKFLNELQKQQRNDKRVNRKKLMEDTVRKLAWDSLTR